MNGIYLLLGSNIGDRLDELRTACKLLQEKNINISGHSSVYETAPWGIHDQDWFLNTGISIETTKSPMELLQVCQDVEQAMGRKREVKWGPRVIDVDILYYKNEVIKSKELVIPHPGIPHRRFTLVLLNEMIPKEVHPMLNKNHSELLKACDDQSTCYLTNYQIDIDLD